MMAVQVSLHFDDEAPQIEASLRESKGSHWIDVELGGNVRLTMFSKRCAERIHALLGQCLQEWDYATGRAKPEPTLAEMKREEPKQFMEKCPQCGEEYNPCQGCLYMCLECSIKAAQDMVERYDRAEGRMSGRLRNGESIMREL